MCRLQRHHTTNKVLSIHGQHLCHVAGIGWHCKWQEGLFKLLRSPSCPLLLANHNELDACQAAMQLACTARVNVT
jgi:hypothetical protein